MRSFLPLVLLLTFQVSTSAQDLSPACRDCAAAWSLLVSTSERDFVTVRPTEIDDVLINPGMGFTTFQRFNGDELNTGLGWTEGLPIVYQKFTGNLQNRNYPPTTIAYFRVDWKFLEPAMDKYRWDLIDKALWTARERGQTLMLGISPYSGAGTDVPTWYRALLADRSPRTLPSAWLVDPEDPLYVKHFGGAIRALGARYDGHPDLELVDISILGPYGEGAYCELLTDQTRKALLDSYLEAFRKTPLVMQLDYGLPVRYILSKRAVGWRTDCLGDMGGLTKESCQMNDYYPEALATVGLQDAWKVAPVALEACWVMQHWKNQGWDVNHIIDESLKWHISSFNAKSSPVPEEWWPQVNRWLKKMGYRFVLRKLTYSSMVRPRGKLTFTSWWENKGVAPCYKKFILAFRLKNESRTELLLTDADITGWLPGDNVCNDAVFLPADMPLGEYEIALALLDPASRQPNVKLAIEGLGEDGWYRLGKIKVENERP